MNNMENALEGSLEKKNNVPSKTDEIPVQKYYFIILYLKSRNV